MHPMIRYILLVITGIILVPSLSFSQEYCDENFTDNEFAGIQKIEMKYDRAAEPTGYVDSVDLYLDLYYSRDNTHEIQPMMILMHGGSFISELGNKSGMEEIARMMVSKGFVVASIGYRTWSYVLGGIPTVNGITDVAVKAMHDLQSAIEFVVAENGKGDFPTVDVGNLVVGGGSAGAIAMLHRLYIDAEDELPEFMATAFDNNNGLWESDSEHYRIAYGLNLSGGIYDTAWIDAGETPLISVHGDQDDVVLYDHGLASGFIELYGSKPIDQRLTEIGVDSYLYTFKGGGHSNIYQDIPLYRDPLIQVLDTGLNLIQDLLCVTTNTPEMVQANLELINTLVQQDLIIRNGENKSLNYDILDMWGRTMQTGSIQPGQQRVSFLAPSSGYYAFRAYRSENGERKSYQRLFYYQAR